eukprot:CAMPEP_0197010284 /NCGR_PEP_ID=MMETSP1380-20130617/53663_1 /TAXON_ID=5936 /ORGANISM="Euplotes crassus, Strain CT5" /LENGTH=42 /DNA_ID= /DNA_START= /DNA_END= /DNA_ORIENTATION=
MGPLSINLSELPNLVRELKLLENLEAEGKEKEQQKKTFRSGE